MGKLFVVPTPVGNLEDMTFRAIRVLKEADLILAEDTRTSGILLKHFEIKNAMQSHHKFNEHKTVESVVNRIKAGETVALISDAVRRVFPIRAFWWYVSACAMVLMWSVCRGQLHLFRLLWLRGYPMNGFVLKVFFPRRRDA
jgi:16S rRNA (cytidine1402-2'-O)-methyltransferase